MQQAGHVCQNTTAPVAEGRSADLLLLVLDGEPPGCCEPCATVSVPLLAGRRVRTG